MEIKTPRADAIVSAIKETLEPYAKEHFSTATAMLLITQYFNIEKLETELIAVQEENVKIKKSFQEGQDSRQKWLREFDRLKAIEKERDQLLAGLQSGGAGGSSGVDRAKSS